MGFAMALHTRPRYVGDLAYKGTMPSLRCEDRQEGRWLYIAGELDHVGYRDVVERFRAAVRQAPGKVVVDLAGVTFAGSLAVSMLLEARSDAHTRLALAGLKPHLRAMLETLGVLQLIPEWR